MLTWPAILLGSVVIGVVCGLLIRGKLALLAGAALPWLILLGVMLYHEYFMPYDGGGASMWPVAQLVAGTPAAILGLVSAWIARRMRRSNQAQVDRA